MEDENFVANMKAKIERLIGREIDLSIDAQSENPVMLDMNSQVPRVVFGDQVLKFPGMARMAIEYVVACIKEERPLHPLEFQMLLRRN
jgi:hypothetical protein